MLGKLIPHHKSDHDVTNANAVTKSNDQLPGIKVDGDSAHHPDHISTLERSASDAGHTRIHENYDSTVDDSNVVNANTNNSSSKTRPDITAEEHQLLQNGYHHKYVLCYNN